MNADVWAGWLAFAVVVILSILLLSGRGSFLIAGYNTLSGEEKKKYHEKRLCRVVGGGLGMIAIILGISNLYQFELPGAMSWLIPWGLFATIAVIVILANTLCKASRI